jgi:alkylation response protein AidB-like acyl-CoA dehydrogenase
MAESLARIQQSFGEPVAQSVLDRITRRFAATAADFDRSAEFPRANFDILAEEGLIGQTVAREFGGGGAGLVESLRVLSAVARGEPSTALILNPAIIPWPYGMRSRSPASMMALPSRHATGCADT